MVTGSLLTTKGSSGDGTLVQHRRLSTTTNSDQSLASLLCCNNISRCCVDITMCRCRVPFLFPAMTLSVQLLLFLLARTALLSPVSPLFPSYKQFNSISYVLCMTCKMNIVSNLHCFIHRGMVDPTSLIWSNRNLCRFILRGTVDCQPNMEHQ